METKVVLEKTSNGYSAYMPAFDGVVATGHSIPEVKKEMHEALAFHLEGMEEEGLEIPLIFRGSYELTFTVDVQIFFEWFSGIMTKSGMAKITSMNQSLVSQYALGLKKPSTKQLYKIESAIHEFGKELTSLTFESAH